MQYKENHYKVICVLPAYNAEKTLENTIKDIDREWVDEINKVCVPYLDEAHERHSDAIKKN